MNERTAYQVAMWANVAVACIAGIAAVFMLIEIAVYGFWMIIPAILLTGVATACGYGVVYFGQRVSGNEKVFSNPVEQEVLTIKQRRELRQRRGGLVMQRALIEIENEQDNIVHRQIEAANDPNKPPHETRFSPTEDKTLNVDKVIKGRWYDEDEGKYR